MVSGSLITRNYANFKGVDFADNEVSLTRSPDALNMWKDYKKLGKCIETRPDIELVATYDNTIFGQFFYKVGNTEMKIVHSGTKLYKEVDGERIELFTGMKPAESKAFVYNQILYIKDGINYLKYDGETIGQVVGYIPTTSIARKPAGGGTTYEDVNMLSAWRKNSFLADGESTEYFLDAKEIDGEAPIVLVNGNTMAFGTDFDYDLATGKITFKVAPAKPLTDGQDNVIITYKKTVAGYADRIKKCTLLQVFDNRVFFSGNQDYPNTVWHSSLNDPSYCSDLDYYNEGLDLSPVKSMVAGNNALWVFKEPSQANTTVFYHNPVIDADYGKIYPSTHSSISTGCVATGINFNDDICFFSDRGMEAINGDITTEQVLAHRSSLIDSKLLSEANYKNMILEEWEGYLLVIIDNKVYLADSRGDETSTKYEWFYWELPINVTSTAVKDGILYLGTNDGIYKFVSEKKNLLIDTWEYSYSDRYVQKYGEYNIMVGSVSATNAYGSASKPLNQVLPAGEYKFTFNSSTFSGVYIKYLDSDGVQQRWENGTNITVTDSITLLSISCNAANLKIGSYTWEAQIEKVTNINSYWTTPYDEFKYPQYQKTTNKRGCVIDMEGEEITVSTKIDNNEFETIDTYTNVKGYVVSRIKKKKWKGIQLKFSSNKPFELYSNTLEAYVGGYVKR